MADALLGIIILAPLALTILLRSNAALAYLAACAGYVLVTFASSDALNLGDDYGLKDLDGNILNLGLLFVPPLVTLALTRKASAKRSRMGLQFAIALTLGGLLAITAKSTLNQLIYAQFYSSEAWDKLQNFEATIVGVGAALSLVVIWFENLGRPRKKHK